MGISSLTAGKSRPALVISSLISGISSPSLGKKASVTVITPPKPEETTLTMPITSLNPVIRASPTVATAPQQAENRSGWM